MARLHRLPLSGSDERLPHTGGPVHHVFVPASPLVVGERGCQRMAGSHEPLVHDGADL
jgi:hypothetical protein